MVLNLCHLHCSGSVEVDLPVDHFTKKIKGFAHIKFSPPENAVKALADLDSSVFQVCCLCLSVSSVRSLPVVEERMSSSGCL